MVRRLESVGRTSGRIINAGTGDFRRYGWVNSNDLLVEPFATGHFASINRGETLDLHGRLCDFNGITWEIVIRMACPRIGRYFAFGRWLWQLRNDLCE